MTVVAAETLLVEAPTVRVAEARGTRGLTGLIVLCLVAGLAGRAVFVTRPFNSDASMFVYGGKVIAEGGRYGREFIDNKLPTVGLMTSVAWRGLGTWWAGYVLVQTGLSLGAVWMLARVARRHFGEHAVLPVWLYGIVLLNFPTLVFGGFELETIQVFFSVV